MSLIRIRTYLQAVPCAMYINVYTQQHQPSSSTSSPQLTPPPLEEPNAAVRLTSMRARSQLLHHACVHVYIGRVCTKLEQHTGLHVAPRLPCMLACS